MTRQMNLLRRSAHAVKRLFRRGEGREQEKLQAAPDDQLKPARIKSSRRHTSGAPSRPPRREADIPMDLLASAYTPAETSSKASFRSDGSDHQLDQEFPLGIAGNRWKDEDRLTNRSGDPRIGTHGRTYEPRSSADDAEETVRR